MRIKCSFASLFRPVDDDRAGFSDYAGRRHEHDDDQRVRREAPGRNR